MALIVNPGSGGNTNFTDGSIPYASGGILVENNSKIRWDNTNSTLYVNGIPWTTSGISSLYSIFTPSGIGATSTDLQTKVRELPATPIDTAAPSDGTDGTTKLNNLFTRSNVLIAPNAYTTTTGGVNFQYKVEGSPSASLVGTNAAASYDFAVTRAGAVLRDVNLTGVSTTQALCSFGSAITDVTIDNANVLNATAIAVAINAALAARWKVVNSTLTGTNYAYLLNDNTTGSGFIIAGNFLTSSNGDAVEINSPTNSVQDGAVTGNIAKASNNGAAVNSGFPIGIASARNWAIVGNVIPQSRQEAFHIEDGVKTLAIVGNVGRDLKKNAVHLLPDPNGESRGSVVVGNNLEADSAASGKTGLSNNTTASAGAHAVTSITRSGSIATVTTTAAHGLYTNEIVTLAGADQTEYNQVTQAVVTGPSTFTYTVPGAPVTPATGTITATGGTYFTPAHVFVGNRVKDFDIGVDSQLGFTIVSNNVIEEATTEGILAAGGILIGENLLSQQVGVPAALVASSGPGFYGKVYSDKTPTAIMTKSGAGCPAMLRGFCFPVASYVHAGGTTDSVPLVAMPSLAKGRVRVRVRGGTAAGDFVYASADILWDGTTMTVSNPLRSNGGSVGSTGTFSVVTGNLTIPVFIAAARVFWDLMIDFDGEWVNA